MNTDAKKYVKCDSRTFKKFKKVNLPTSVFYCFVYFITSAQSEKLVEKYCDLQTGDLKGLCYVKETLAVLTHSPNQLVVDKTSNTLYFSFDIGQREYIPCALNIIIKNITVLKGPMDAFAIAFNDKSGEVFFGGVYGIFKYNPLSKTLKRLAVKYLDIWWLFIKNNKIYYSTLPYFYAYFYHNKTTKRIDRLKYFSVQQFVMDYEDNIFFINQNGLYGVKNDSDVIFMLRNDLKFVGMAMDNKGDVFASADDGIYLFTMNKIELKIKKVLNITGVLGLTFDKDNHLIYSDSQKITRLVPISSSNCTNRTNTNKL